MKDYKEIAENVLRRGSEQRERERRKKRALVRGGCTAALGLAVVIGVGALWGKTGRQDENPERQLANLGTGGFGMDSGQGGFSEKDGTMDGDPVGYGIGADKDGVGNSGNSFSDDPVPGGKTEKGEEGELDPEDAEGTIVEDSMPARVEEADLPDRESAADQSGQLPGGAFVNGASASEEGTTEFQERKKIISSYPEDAVYCYAAPGNGEFFCSVPLTHAMEEYGDDVLYRVVAEIFCNGDAINPVSEEAKYEWDRLEELGYKLVRKRYDDGEGSGSYFVLQATKEQLEKFPISEEYGYVFRFFDEP